MPGLCWQKITLEFFFCSFDPFDALYRSAKTIFEFGRVKKVFFDYENHHYTRTIKGHLMADSRVRVKNGQLCLAIKPNKFFKVFFEGKNEM